MRYTFTAVITPEDGKCYVRVPDITGCVTTGKDIEDAVAQITDALSGCLVVWEDQGLPIPPQGKVILLQSMMDESTWP